MRQLVFALFLLFSRQAMAVAMPTDTPSLTPTISPTFSPSPTATPICALGDVTVYNTSTTMIKDTIFSEHFTVPQAVQLTALRFNQRYCYHNPIYIGIYQGTASDPSFLLGQTSAYTGSGGAEVYDQSVFNLPDINLQPGVDYWLAFVIGGSGSDEIFTGSYGLGAEDLWNNSYTAGPLPTGTYDKGSGGGSGVNVGVQYIFCGYVDGTATPTYTVTTTSTATPSPTPTVTVTRVCQQGTITSWGTFLPVEKDNIVFQHFTVPSAQQLTAIQFPLNSASGGNYSIGIYQGSSTSPTTLIGQVSGTWPVGGTYYTVNLPDMDLNPGSDYWWAILSGATTNPLLYYGLDPDLAYHVPYGAGPLPDSAPALGAAADNLESVLIFCGYVDGTPTVTRTATKTSTRTASPSFTTTATRTPTASATATATRTVTATFTETPTPVEVVTQSIPTGPSVVVTMTDGAKVSITAGAFGSTVSFTMERFSSAPVPQPGVTQFSLLGVVYEINAGGATLLQPVTITLPYDPAALTATGRPASALTVGYYNGSVWTQISGTVNTVAHTITFTTTHFSIWGVGVKPVDPSTPLASAPSGVSGFFVNPVVKKGDPLCAYPAKPLSDSQWDLFNLAGQKVGTLSQGGATVCMETTSIAPGIYFLRARSSFADGSAAEDLKKVVILP